MLELGQFILASILLALIWLAYLFLNERLDKINSGLTQDILGTIIAFSVLMAIGGVLYFFATPFLTGLFLTALALVLAAILYLGIKRLIYVLKRAHQS